MKNDDVPETLQNENTDEKDKSTPSPDQESSQSANPKKKFIFNCTKCGKCCEKWEEIPIYLEDLQRWVNDGSIYYVLSFLQVIDSAPNAVEIVMRKDSSVPMPNTNKEEQQKDLEDNPSGCPLYDYENKICNLYHSMPIHCAAYPLAYNGKKYYLVDKDCPGLGHGQMTKEKLQLARTRAEAHYNAKNSSKSVIPVLYTLILTNIMKKSQEAMGSLSPEDKEQLNTLLSKSKEQTDEEEASGNNSVNSEETNV